MTTVKTSRRFPTTTWTLIQAAKNRAASGYLAAMDRFIAGYWKPVFYFLRAKGYALHQAEDLTQEFFTRFLERDWIQRADPQRGRFRNFLLRVLIRFLSDQGNKRAPRQNQFERQFLSIDGLISDSERKYQPAQSETPEDVFMRQWAASLMENVRNELRQVCEAEGHPIWYEVFAATHFPDSTSKRLSQEALGQKLGIRRDQVRYGLDQATKWFRQLLRTEVEQQVGSRADIGEEIRDLMRLLGK